MNTSDRAGFSSLGNDKMGDVNNLHAQFSHGPTSNWLGTTQYMLLVPSEAPATYMCELVTFNCIVTDKMMCIMELQHHIDIVL